jgi:hypothetical protein
MATEKNSQPISNCAGGGKDITGKPNSQRNTDELTQIAAFFREKIKAKGLELLTPRATRDIWFLTDYLYSNLPKPPKEARVQRAILIFAIHPETMTFRLVINRDIGDKLKKVLIDTMKKSGGGENGLQADFPYFFDRNTTMPNFSSVDENEIEKIWNELGIDNIVGKVEGALKNVLDELRRYASPHL